MCLGLRPEITGHCRCFGRWRARLRELWRGFLNPEIPGEFPADKAIVLDTRVRLDGGERVDVEMQARGKPFLAGRFLYYAARDFSEQLPRGGDYADLTATVSVLWVDARLFPEERRFHLRFELLETTTGAPYSDHLTLHVLQLPEIPVYSAPDLTAPERALRNWGRFFGAKSDEDRAELAREDATMATAVEALEHLSQDPEARRLAREREDSVLLYELEKRFHRREGRREGREEGREEARAEARERLKAILRKLCTSMGIEPTPEQRAALDDPATDLDALLETVISERRWP